MNGDHAEHSGVMTMWKKLLIAGVMLAPVDAGARPMATARNPYPTARAHVPSGRAGPSIRPFDPQGPIVGYRFGMPLYAGDPYVVRANAEHARHEAARARQLGGPHLDHIFISLGEPVLGPAGSKYGAARSFMDGELSDAEIHNAEVNPQNRPITRDPVLLQYLPRFYFNTAGGRAALERLVDNRFDYTDNEAGKRDIADRLLNLYNPGTEEQSP